MNHYEREYFVSRARSGVFFLDYSGRKLKLVSPTLEEEYLANEIFRKAYDSAEADGVMSEEEIDIWQREKGLWTQEKDQTLDNLKEDLEKLKIKCYEYRADKAMLSQAKIYLRTAERALADITAEKHELFARTREGFALQEKSYYIFSMCCFDGDKRVDLEQVDVNSLFFSFNKMWLSETQLRDLVKHDPWKLCWIMKDQAPLFSNEINRTLTQDQKGLVLWSNMYDNISEAVDPPSEEVIADDDMLDGWLIIQRRQAKSDKAKAEIEKRTNAKIANSDEILLIAKSGKEAKKIHDMNSVNMEAIRKQRLATVKRQGGASDLDFQDKKLEMRAEQNKLFRETGRRK